MSAIFNQDDVPNHLLNIPELSFGEDLFADRIGGQWFRLGARTVRPQGDDRGVENFVSRQSVLLAPGDFADIFDKLESIGNLGKPEGFIAHEGDQKKYVYAPFHQF